MPNLIALNIKLSTKNSSKYEEKFISFKVYIYLPSCQKDSFDNYQSV